MPEVAHKKDSLSPAFFFTLFFFSLLVFALLKEFVEYHHFITFAIIITIHLARQRTWR